MSGQRLGALAPFAAAFFLFALLLNSVGPVILQSMASFGVTKTDASLLEGFKDLPIAFASFFAGTLLPRIGYRRATMVSLIGVALACAAMPLLSAFWAIKLLFVVVGVAFAAVKTSVYVIVGLVTDDPQGHASVTSTLEGVFTLGVLSSYWLFSLFIDPKAPTSLRWLGVYPWLAGAAALVALIVSLSPLDERSARRDDLGPSDVVLAMPRLLKEPFVLAFLVSAFFGVLVEQSLSSWLPTFNREVLGLSPTLAVQLASLYAVGIAVGRLAGGLVLRRLPWPWVIGPGLVAAAMIMGGATLVATRVAKGAGAGWSDLPLTAYAVPIVGLLLAPIYPTLCSAVLSALPRARHSAMTGLILISSALGGTIGSAITGRVFAALSGKSAFLAVIPSMLGLLVLALVFDAALKRALGRREGEQG